MQSISPEDIVKFLEENPGFFLEYPEQLKKSGLMEDHNISSKILNIRNRLFEKMREDRQNLLNALEDSIKIGSKYDSLPIINVSRGIIYAGDGSLDDIRLATKEYTRKIRNIL